MSSFSSNSKELSFFIPFKNEEAHLLQTVETILPIAKRLLTDFEIVLVNDGSTDASAEVALELAKIENVRFIDLKKNYGFGKAYLEGFKACQKRFALYLTADGDVNAKELREILRMWNGRSPLIQSAHNSHERKLFRYLLSKSYTAIVQFLSQTKWPYYNGFNILPTSNREKLKLQDFGFCTQAHLLLQVLRNRNDVQFLTTTSQFHDETSQALTLKNVMAAVKFFFYLTRAS